MTNHPYTGKDFHERSVFYFDVKPEPVFRSNSRYWELGVHYGLGEKCLIQHLIYNSPFKVGDQIYFAEEWVQLEKPDGTKSNAVLLRNIPMLNKHFKFPVQPASTMPFELAEHFKTITKVGVELVKYIIGIEIIQPIPKQISPYQSHGNPAKVNKPLTYESGLKYKQKWEWKVEVE